MRQRHLTRLGMLVGTGWGDCRSAAERAEKGRGRAPNAGKASTPAKLPATGTIARRRAYHGAAAVPAWRASGGQIGWRELTGDWPEEARRPRRCCDRNEHFGFRVFRRKPWRASGLAGELGVPKSRGRNRSRVPSSPAPTATSRRALRRRASRRRLAQSLPHAPLLRRMPSGPALDLALGAFCAAHPVADVVDGDVNAI